VLERIGLRNFKCFKAQELDASALTIFAGQNGTGKSSAIQALLLLRQSFLQNLLLENAIALNGDLVNIGTASDALYEEAQKEHIVLNLVYSHSTEYRWLLRYDRTKNLLAIESSPNKIDPNVVSVFSDNFQYLQAERIGPRSSFEISDYLVRQHRQLGPKAQYTAHFLSVYGDDLVLDGLAHPLAKSSRLKDQIEQWMFEIIPGLRMHVTEHSHTNAMDVVTLQYSFENKRRVTNKFRSTNVGFGVTYGLPIFVAGLSAKPGGLLLIENPEAHLHPRGQRKIAEFLCKVASLGVQVIIETHSDHVLNGVRLSVRKGLLDSKKVSVNYFSRSADNDQILVSTPKINSEGKFDVWPEGFFDEWDTALEELF
jgi:predicted ATPase